MLLAVEGTDEIPARHDERVTAAGGGALEMVDREERRFLAQALDVGAGQPVGALGQFAQIDIGRQRDPFAAEAEHGFPFERRRRGEAEQVVESSAAQERRVHALQAVGRRHQDHALHVPEIVDLAQQLAQDALVDLATELVLRAVAQLRRDRRRWCRRTGCTGPRAWPS